MPDPIWKRFGYGQLWSLRPVCSHNRAGSYWPDPTSRILFSSSFTKKAWAILCKPDPSPIWSYFFSFLFQKHPEFGQSCGKLFKSHLSLMSVICDKLFISHMSLMSVICDKLFISYMSLMSVVCDKLFISLLSLSFSLSAFKHQSIF